MGRHRRKEIPQEEAYDWPFEISINLTRARPRIAFMSGCPRDFYPDDCGFSKFGMVYGPPDPEGPLCQYTPSTETLDKPVSLLGYGMGGLSAPRFAKGQYEDNPAPNIYQSQIVPRRVTKSERVRRQRWSDFVEMYEQICEEQFEKEERQQKEQQEALMSMTPKDRKRTLGTDASAMKATRHMSTYKSSRHQLARKAKPCGDNKSAFGMSLRRSRFESSKYNETAGVGTYDIQNVRKNESFLVTTPDGELKPMVRMVCLPGGCDTCMACAADLVTGDYYQTRGKRRIRCPDPTIEGKYTMVYLSLCRECYCSALQKGLDPWAKEEIEPLFMKARHCNCAHDHKEGHDQFLTKSSCKQITNLARREIIFSRFFKDNPCRKEIW